MNELVLLQKLDETIAGFRNRKRLAQDRGDVEAANIQYIIEVALLNVHDCIKESINV